MADDFAYLNARVRVRRGTLLKESFFQEALDLSFADFLRLLSETVYGGELAGQGLPDVDRAVMIAPMLGVAKAPGAWRSRPWKLSGTAPCVASKFAMPAATAASTSVASSSTTRFPPCTSRCAAPIRTLRCTGWRGCSTAAPIRSTSGAG